MLTDFLSEARPYGQPGAFPLLLLLSVVVVSCGRNEAAAPPVEPRVPGAAAARTEGPGYTYLNDKNSDVPWSVQVLKFERTRPDLELCSMHAKDKAVGLSTLSEQIAELPRGLGRPVAAVNGDFYQTDGRNPYGGDPRGLQIVEGELISAPTDQVSFWIEPDGTPRMDHVESQFRVDWPGGSSTPLGLNEERSPGQTVLYTPRLGPSTRTSDGGLELVLEAAAGSPWLPLKPAVTYTAKVKDVRQSGNTPLSGNVMVLSLGPSLVRNTPGLLRVQAGDAIKLSLATSPDLKGVRTAISGGNVLVRHGKKQKIEVPATGAYKYRSMTERHPRTALGVNAQYYFLVQVDGRQPRLSVGMTLGELGDYMYKLGCTEAMSLDGGASSTFWLEGKIMNSPCHGRERDIANGLVVIQKERPSSHSRTEPSQRGS
jgi:hypothetical protein